MPYVLRSSFIFLAVLALSGCGDLESKSPTVSYNRNDYERNSCLYGFDDGGNVVNRFDRPQMKTLSFGKVLDIAQVEAVLAASARKMVTYMQGFGLDVFGVSKPTNGCQNLGALPAIPAGLLNYWDQVDTSSSGGKFFIVGLFISKTDAVKYNEPLPAIMVRTDADRWTLVHEFMHFLFSRQRNAAGEMSESDFEDAWLTDLRNIYPDLKGLNENRLSSDPVYAQKMVTAWSQFSEKVLNYLKNYPLEEITIENTLYTYYVNSQFIKTSDYNRRNSLLYMEANYQRAASYFDLMFETGNKIQPFASDDNLRRFQADYKNLQKLKSEVDALHGSYFTPVSAKSIPLNLGAATGSCGHQSIYFR